VRVEFQRWGPEVAVYRSEAGRAIPRVPLDKAL